MGKESPEEVRDNDVDSCDDDGGGGNNGCVCTAGGGNAGGNGGLRGVPVVDRGVSVVVVVPAPVPER